MSNPFDRQPTESQKAYAARMDYCQMGPGRSLRGLIEQYIQQSQSNPKAKPPTSKLSTLFSWSSVYGWVESAKAWDAQQQQLENERWLERRLQVREADWTAANELRNLAAQILAEGPKFLQTSRKLIKGKVIKDEEGKTIGREVDREIITVALDGRMALLAVDLASKLQRLSAEMAPPKQQQVNLNIDFSLLTDEQLTRIAGGEDPVVVISTPGPGRTGTAETPEPDPDSGESLAG